MWLECRCVYNWRNERLQIGDKTGKIGWCQNIEICNCCVKEFGIYSMEREFSMGDHKRPNCYSKVLIYLVLCIKDVIVYTSRGGLIRL